MLGDEAIIERHLAILRTADADEVNPWVPPMLSAFALLVGLPRIVAHPELQNSWAGTAITLAVAGAAWMVADTLRSRVP